VYTKGKGWFEFSQFIELDDSWSYFYLALHIRKVSLKLDGLQGQIVHGAYFLDYTDEKRRIGD